MKLLKVLYIALAVLLGISIAYSWVRISRQSRRIAADETQRSHNLKSIGQLQESLRQEQLQEANDKAADQNSETALQSSLAQSEQALSASSQQLSAAQTRIADLERRLAYSRRRHHKALVQAKQQSRRQVDETQTRLDSLKHRLANAQHYIQASRLRVSALEAVNAKLSQEQSAATAQTQTFMPVLRKLQPLERRRDTYVTSVMSHYQEIARELENMRGMLDANRDSNSNALSNEALYRIRDALSLANNDLRQLNNLNVQIRHIETQLPPEQAAAKMTR
ncbi:MAG: hypothetical protein ACRD2B_11285 [Terriglobia bacterium]